MCFILDSPLPCTHRCSHRTAGVQFQVGWSWSCTCHTEIWGWTLHLLTRGQRLKLEPRLLSWPLKWLKIHLAILYLLPFSVIKWRSSCYLLLWQYDRLKKLHAELEEKLEASEIQIKRQSAEYRILLQQKDVCTFCVLLLLLLSLLYHTGNNPLSINRYSKTGMLGVLLP